MKLILSIFFTIVAILLTPNAYAQNGTYRHDVQYPFLIVSDDTTSQAPVFSDKEFYEYSASVQFEVSKSDISPNNPFLKLYNDVIIPAVNDRHLQLRKVFIRGAASPEGPYEFNRKLGKDRSMALLTELRRNLMHQYIASDIEINSVTEDYGLLCILMEEAKDKDCSIVKRIYDECQGDELCCKQKLMSVDGGALWTRLTHTYFPKLRSARLILWFSKPDRMHTPDAYRTRDTLYIYRKDTIVIKEELHSSIREMYDHTTNSFRDYQETDTVMRHPLFALKTNLLFDAATLLNGELELPVGKRFSIMAESTWPWWLDRSHNKWCVEMGSVGLETRLWFHKWRRHSTFSDWKRYNNSPLHGWFAGIYANCGYYDFQLKERSGSQGEFAGAGVSLGYSSYIGRHWRLEFSVAGGAALYRDRKYYIEDNTPSEPDREQHLWKDGVEKKHTWIGPTKAKISLSYILTRKCKKGGKK